MTITSLAGVVGQSFCSAYAASKLGLEGWMESLAPEVERFGIRTTIVEPGFFRTELLEEASTQWGELSVDDHAAETATTVEQWRSMNGQQAGDPAKLAKALVEVVGLEAPPVRWAAGADAVEAVRGKGFALAEQAGALPDLSEHLAVEA